MPKYTLKIMEQVRGKQIFSKLFVDGIAPFDVFIEGLEDVYKSEVLTIYAVMNQIAMLRSLPSTKFHFYSDGKDGVRECEFKTKHLRVYAIETVGGKIVILGGKKSNQKKDQVEFRRLKRDYIQSL